MPELPEVETVRIGLAPFLERHKFTRVVTNRRDLRVPFPPNFSKRLEGRTVVRIRRRAKYLLADLDSGETLVVHLGMSGRMSVYSQGKKRELGQYVYDQATADAGRGKHDHVVMDTDAPARIVFTDHRRFGLMTILDTATLSTDRLFKDMGIEPLSEAFTTAWLTRVLDGKRTPIKSALLDQRVVAGLGNIYVCEALFRAHISPKRCAATVSGKRTPALVAAIRDVLKEAIKAGGSSLRDYAKADGALGEFQHRFAVYDRAGDPCTTAGCPGTIKRMVQAGRSTFHCPSCQR
jgi:formamidopyrimidine-DNA glycosylase